MNPLLDKSINVIVSLEALCVLMFLFGLISGALIVFLICWRDTRNLKKQEVNMNTILDKLEKV
jgi:hypothetical protein